MRSRRSFHRSSLFSSRSLPFIFWQYLSSSMMKDCASQCLRLWSSWNLSPCASTILSFPSFQAWVDPYSTRIISEESSAFSKLTLIRQRIDRAPLPKANEKFWLHGAAWSAVLSHLRRRVFSSWWPSPSWILKGPQIIYLCRMRRSNVMSPHD